MGLNHLVPLSFHIRAGQLDYSWVSRFYKSSSPQESSQLFLSRGGGQLEDSLYPTRGQPPGPMCNLNSQVSDLCLDHLCLSMGDFLPRSLEPELCVVGYFSHLENRLVGHLHIVIFSH